MRPEFWTMGDQHAAGDAARSARRAELQGWDGVVFTDTQSTGMELWVTMTIAALSTERVRIGAYVTNPLTRHPAVTASAIAALHRESGGRAVLGIGRGDSALAYLGLAPASVESLRSYVSVVQGYLRGEPVRFDDIGWAGGVGIGAGLPLADRPDASRLTWLGDEPAEHKPPVFVAASGPRVIRLAAGLADRVLIAVGADPERVRAGVELARSVTPGIAVSAFVNVVVDDDRDRAFALGSRGLAGHARFNAMHGTTSLAAGAREQRAVFEAVAAGYDMTRHGRGVNYDSVITPEFAARFAIFGPAAYCVERLAELVELGVDRFHVQQGPRLASAFDEAKRQANERFLTEVMSAFR